MPNKILTIAGSDCSGGAGIQADIKTITVHKMYAMSVLTALTAQNTTGVSAIYEISPQFVSKQLDSIFTDITPDSIKVGMVSQSDIIHVIAQKLKLYDAKNIVIDPVMVSTSGSKLIDDNALASLITDLFPLATLITPNIFEAEILSNISIHNKADMIQAAQIISKITPSAILIKGGHLSEDAADLLFHNDEIHWFTEKRIKTKNTHGTGCTLSTAIACFLSEGRTLIESVELAKKYLTQLLLSDTQIGKGRGPLNHTLLLK